MDTPLDTRSAREAGASREQLRLMKRVAVILFVVGGLTAASGVLTTAPSADARLVRYVAAVGFVGLGVILQVLPLRRRTIEVAIFASVGLLSGMVALLQPIGVVAFFYRWPVVYSAYFCSRPMLVGVVAAVAMTEAAGLAVNSSVELGLDTFNGTVISVGLMGALVTVQQRREARLRRSLERAAETDPLTGLLNRRAFNPGLEALIEQAHRGAMPLTLALIDVDHFKRFNDTHGHLAGDRALIRLSRAMEAAAGHRDLVGRFGGEEFVIALPGGDVHAALRLTERLARRLAQEDLSDELRLTVSVGIASIDGDRLGSFDRLVIAADEALYVAKASGRGRPAWWAGGRIEVDDPSGDFRLAA